MNRPANAPIRVLIVDDEPHLVVTLTDDPIHLFNFFWTVFGAHSREEALEAVRQNRADVVILDVTKPGSDGFGTLEELRRFSKIPVVILTDPGDEDQLARGLSLGADDSLNKPLNLRHLSGRIRPPPWHDAPVLAYQLQYRRPWIERQLIRRFGWSPEKADEFMETLIRALTPA